jgi:hypothetical protein
MSHATPGWLCRVALLAASLPFLPAGARPAAAQESSREWLDRCAERSGENGRVAHCEIREASFAAPARLRVSARPNGGVDLTGSSRSDVHVTARVQTWAENEEEARALARQIDLETGGDRVAADGPSRTPRGRGWSVSFVIDTPSRIDLDLESVNGGLAVRGVAGDLVLHTTNGGIRMAQVAGTVRARSTNGGLDVQLAGDRWTGSGLELETTNGSIELSVPAAFAADLSARTVNGSIRSDFPITVQGRIGRSVEARIGGGGAPVRLATTNGAIELRNRD